MNEKVNERYTRIAGKYDGQNALSLGKAFVAARNVLDEISAEKAEAEAEVDFLKSKLAEVMANEGMTKFSIEVGDGEEKRIRVQEEVFVSATHESGAAGRILEILKDSGNGGIVKETVAPATLKKFVCDLRKKGDGMPDPVLMQMIEAGMTVTAKDMARFY